MIGFEFSREIDNAKIGIDVVKSREEQQNHISLFFKPIVNNCCVGDCGDNVKAGEPFFGMVFFHEESINVLINALEIAKKVLSESEGNT